MMSFFSAFKAQLQSKLSMSFAEFMQLALYHPHYGYYTAKHHSVGAKGDFITAPELTPLFGYTLANQCAPLLKQISHSNLFEFGAGTGQLCMDILTRLLRLDALPEKYFILDLSPSLKQQQQDKLSSLDPLLFKRIEWIDQWPKQPFNGIMIANEVLDAMPVHRFLKTSAGLFESMISLDETQQQLIESFLPCENESLIAHVQNTLTHNIIPYASECNLWVKGWLKQCSRCLNQGVLFLIDYGFPRHEYYHPDRHQGTLMCHSKHQAHAHPLFNPGHTDLSAHVDFSHVADCAYDVGFTISGYTDQASFLLANQILDLISTEENEAFIQTQAIKKLTHPHEMGELFKVMALTKHIQGPLSGFLWNDKRARL